jgi:serine/threonine-protein kinase
MYMSPEAVRGARDLTPQSDQYSLGVVLYECITGRAPFAAESLLAVLDAVARGDVEPPRRYRPDLSQVMEEAILRAMSPEPRLRFPNVRELGRVLCQCADHRTRLLWMPTFGSRDGLEVRTTAVLGSTPLRTAAPLHLPAAVTRRSSPRRSWAALGAVGLAGLVYWGWQRSQPVPIAGGEAPEVVRALQPPAAMALPAPPSEVPATPPAESRAGVETPANATESALLAARPPARAHTPSAASEDAVPPRAVPPRRVPPRPPPRATRPVAPPQGAPSAAAPPAPVPPASPAPAAPAAARKVPTHGANHAPILD